MSVILVTFIQQIVIIVFK